MLPVFISNSKQVNISCLQEQFAVLGISCLRCSIRVAIHLLHLVIHGLSEKAGYGFLGYGFFDYGVITVCRKILSGVRNLTSAYMIILITFCLLGLFINGISIACVSVSINLIAVFSITGYSITKDQRCR